MPWYKYQYRELAKLQRKALRKVGKPKEDEAIYMCRNIAQEWAREANKDKKKVTMDTIPTEYKRHTKIFSKEESKCFPAAREEDMTIILKNDAPAVINCKVYPLTKDERAQLQKFLAMELELRRIIEGPLPYTSLVYFINKKDFTEKCIIMDY